METIARGTRTAPSWSLRVRHTHANDGAAMAVIEVLPGCFARMSPLEMRSFAAALALAADDCDSPQTKRSLAVYPVLGR
jgi:hypothetical protein